jgi:hypothetical protein
VTVRIFSPSHWRFVAPWYDKRIGVDRRRQ